MFQEHSMQLNQWAALIVGGMGVAAPSFAGAVCQGGSPPADCSTEPSGCTTETLYYGDGADGDLAVATGFFHALQPTTSALTGSAAAGDTSITLQAPTGFDAGDWVMLHSVQGSAEAGRYEIRRITGKVGAVVSLDAPLSKAFPGLPNRVLVYKMFRYNNVTVAPGAELRSSLWNGNSGGIVPIMVAGTLSVQGQITVDGRGYRGGLGTAGASPAAGQDGEGWMGGPKQDNTAENFGGGGGGFHQPGVFSGGGGGGAHFTAGTNGQADQPAGRGFGGVAFAGTSSQRLLMGGGGGGASDAGATDGARGGGIIYIRAANANITGTISSRGGTATSISCGSCDAGGGGAGGSVVLITPSTVAGSVFNVTGGLGGTSAAFGNGGNGGNGYAIKLNPPASCIPDSDGDGLNDQQDACINDNPGGFDVNGDGCTDDLDADGTPDSADSCYGPQGDVNSSGASDVADAMCALLASLWTTGNPPACLGVRPQNADLNCDGLRTVSDVQLSIHYALGMPLPSGIAQDPECVDTCAMPYAHTIALDTTQDFTSNERFVTQTSGFERFVTWDDTNLYLGRLQPVPLPANANQYWHVWYIGGTPGTTAGVNYNTQAPVLPFAARWQIQWRVDGAELYIRQWNGTTWLPTQAFPGTAAYSAGYGELQVPLATLGLGRFLEIHAAVVREEAGNEKTFASAPATSIHVPAGDPLQGPYDPNYARWHRFDRNLPPTYVSTLYNHTIKLDQFNDFLPEESFASNTSGYTNHVAWSPSTLFLGYTQPGGASPEWRVWYIGGTPGSTTGVTYNTQSATLPFAARWQLQWRTNSSSDIFLLSWNGTSWGSSTNVSAQAFYGANHGTIGLSRATLGIPEDFELHVAVVREQAGNERTFGASPASSFAVPGGNLGNAPYDPNYGAGLWFSGDSSYSSEVFTP
jgi:hypothetical protein